MLGEREESNKSLSLQMEVVLIHLLHLSISIIVSHCKESFSLDHVYAEPLCTAADVRG